MGISKKIKEAREISKQAIYEFLMKYVLLHGEDVTEYDLNEFGLCEEEEYGVKVLKVLNMFDNGGCCFSYALHHSLDIYMYMAFHCLYVIEDEDGQSLKYYALINDGHAFDEEDSEPDHSDVYTLPLSCLDQFLDFVEHYEDKITSIDYE